MLPAHPDLKALLFMKYPLVLLLLTALGTSALRAQVINIENRRLHTDSVRRAGDVNISFLLNSTNGRSIMTFRGNSLVQFKSKNYKHLWLGIANYDFAKAAGSSFVNAFFVHLRHNYKVNEWLRWEAFTQLQRNLPLGIESRLLTGTGPRFKIYVGKVFEMYVATIGMLEHENTAKPDNKISRDWRSSSYVSFNIRFPNIKAVLSTTSYYQPLFNDIADYRFTSDSRFSFRITEKLQVYTNFNYFYDARPPVGIRKSTMNLEQGFGIKL